MPGKTKREWAVLFARLAFRFLVVGGAATAGAVATHEIKEVRFETERAESAAEVREIRVQTLRELSQLRAAIIGLELSCPEPTVVCESPEIPRHICVCASEGEYGLYISPQASTWED